MGEITYRFLVFFQMLFPSSFFFSLMERNTAFGFCVICHVAVAVFVVAVVFVNTVSADVMEPIFTQCISILALIENLSIATLKL